MDDARDDIPLTDEERRLAERGAALVAAAVTSDEARAPLSLRSRLEDQRATSAAPQRKVARRWSPRWIAGVCAITVAVGGTIAVALQPGSNLPGGPDVLRVATITRLLPTGPAPASLGGLKPKLDAEVEGVAFPDWSKEFDWDATGVREDELGGRDVRTVSYEGPSGTAIGYSIVSGKALAVTRADETVQRGAITYRVYRRGGRTTVAWEEQGHTCVVDAPPDVAVDELVELASWDNF